MTDIDFWTPLPTQVVARDPFLRPPPGRRLRFHFARRRETLEAAVEKLQNLKARLPAGPRR
jgi:hypothetical protein